MVRHVGPSAGAVAAGAGGMRPRRRRVEPDILARLQIRYREIPIVFADSRKFAEEWTYRFLAAAVADREPG